MSLDIYTISLVRQWWVSNSRLGQMMRYIYTSKDVTLGHLKETFGESIILLINQNMEDVETLFTVTDHLTLTLKPKILDIIHSF
jgi:hypothetical protein